MKRYILFIAIYSLISSPLSAQNHKLSLVDAIQIAERNNKDLQLQELEEKISTAKVTEQNGKLLPHIGISSSYANFNDKPSIFLPGSFLGNPQQGVTDVAVGGKNTFSSSLNIQQAVVSENVRRQIKTARISNDIQNIRTEEVKAEVILNVTQNYYELLLKKAITKVYMQSLDHNIKALEDSRMLLAQGKALRTDTLQNFIRVENIRTALSNISNQEKIVETELKIKLGLETGVKLELTDSLIINSITEISAEKEIASENILNTRPDIRMNMLDQKFKKSIIRESSSLRLPSLYLIGSYQIQAQADNMTSDTYNWPKTSFAGLQLNIPLFAGGMVNSRVRQTKLGLQQSKINMEHSVENAKAEIFAVNAEFIDAINRYELQNMIVESAQLSYNIVSDRYSNGISSRLEMTDAELSLSQAKMNRLQTIYEIKMGKVKLDKAMGKLHFN